MPSPWRLLVSPFSRSLTPHLRNQDLFEYTSGRWLVNEALRLAERKVVFDVAELGRLAAQSVNRSPDDMVAHIPYKCTIPRYFGVASEAATMAFLRSHGIPIPEVYGYSPDANNPAETEYIFTESIRGTKLVDQWFDVQEPDMISVVGQLVQLEKKMMSIPFPAGGALYCTEDMEKADAPHTPLDDDPGFCVGPDTRSQMWFGKRSEMDVNRGPYKDVKEALSQPAEKELAYLTQFGRPQVPWDPVAKILYNLEEQQPSDHIEDLHDYIRIAPLLIPKDPALSRFTIRHPQIQAENLIVSRSTDGSSHIVALVNWHHTAILPAFLLNELPYESEDISQESLRPTFPENLDELCEQHQEAERISYQRRLMNYHYLREAEEHHPAHHRCVTDVMTMVRHDLFCSAGKPWQGFSLLQGFLVGVATMWSGLSDIDGGGRGRGPCPLWFQLEVRVLQETSLMLKDFVEAKTMIKALQEFVGANRDNWVPAEDYQRALEQSWLVQQNAPPDAKIIECWPWNDFDEQE
ncbi:protein kinase subdomain-containing protein PKL/CAK/Fmp29 [Roridomyces roridus]|uniref:Protein kinase subdomain-containing protein PKL/CAK/Fmp29 n=1 Tax=Roridomyces roridus TaxID=1738132 RepID=A0AAD7C861_9AGAR|nr:protein kinase subdomain-containing protein PKL/CAK/Fmp29 [Roridomyces roridus]